MSIFTKLLVCFIAGAGAGAGTGFAGMSAAAIIGPMLYAFTGMPTYQALGVGLISDVLASGASALVYRRHGNLDIKNSLPLLITVLVLTVIGSFTGSLVPNSSMGGMMLLFVLTSFLGYEMHMAVGTSVFSLITLLYNGFRASSRKLRRICKQWPTFYVYARCICCVRRLNGASLSFSGFLCYDTYATVS